MDRHADQSALRGDDRAAFRGHRKPDVETKFRVDPAAVGTVPRAAGERNDPERGEDVAMGSPDCNGKMARPRIGCDRQGRHWRFRAEPQHRDVGGGIASGQCRFDAASVGQREREVGVALHGLLRGDDQARLPDDPARGKSATAMDGDHRPRSRRDGR